MNQISEHHFAMVHRTDALFDYYASKSMSKMGLKL